MLTANASLNTHVTVTFKRVKWEIWKIILYLHIAGCGRRKGPSGIIVMPGKMNWLRGKSKILYKRSQNLRA